MLNHSQNEAMEQSNEDGTSKTEQIRFLSDQPLTAEREREMRFGHLGIAENLRKIISVCPTPFTIGLFGKWGTGKTTILNVLREKLRADKIAVVNFDVWKHEGDSLRRTFLKETTKQLKEGEYLLDFDLSERLDAHISRTFRGGFTVDKSRIKALVLIIVAIVVAGLAVGLFWPQYLGIYLSILFSGGLVAAFLLWLLQQAMTTETITTATDRLQDPHEFEAEFKKIISKMSPEKLLIVIDNLDRASHEKAVELLSTIKTFLEQKKCIFLIACDDEAIKKHLEGVYIQGSEKSENRTPFDVDEFLRKFFNTFLRISEFIDTELQTYTEDLLKETKVPQLDSSDVAYVITSAFRDNPRQIKQFINTLLAHFLLAEEREEDGLIKPAGAITGKVGSLAKFLIIRQQFPAEYERIVESHLTTLEQIGEGDFDDKF